MLSLLFAAVILSISSSALGAPPADASTAAPMTRLSAKSATGSAMSKGQVLDGLKHLQKKQLQTIENVDQSIKKVLQESQSVSLRSGDAVATEKHLLSLPQRLSALQARREELLLRREFIDQIIFQIDSKWTTQPLASFLEQQLIDMASNELTSAATTKPTLWRFYTYLSIAVREIPEPREDLIAFLGGYLEFSSILMPKSPSAYLDSRHYTNGAISQAARPARRDEVGSLADKRLRELGMGTQSATTTEAPPVVELRARQPSPQQPVNTQ